MRAPLLVMVQNGIPSVLISAPWMGRKEKKKLLVGLHAAPATQR